MRYAHVLVWATVALLLVIVAVTLLHLNRDSGRRRDSQVAACERGNIIRETVNTIVIHAGLADDVGPLPIVDCRATVK